MDPNNKFELQKELQIDEVEFKKVLPILVDELCSDPKFKDIQSSMNWLRIVLNQNVPHGKRTRAHLSLAIHRYLNPIRTKEEDFLCYIAGWMIEILQAAALIADDLMDGSETRRGMLCWYKNNHVGLTAINDAFLLENIVYYIAVKYFEHKEYFIPLLKLLFEYNLKTILGQSLDLRLSSSSSSSSSSGNNNNDDEGFNTTTTTSINFDKFNELTYKTLVKYETSYYTFTGPITFALTRSGIRDESILSQVEALTLQIGELFQIQDDFLDCYGNTKLTGKIGSDIKDGKLTWLIVKAIELGSDEQKRILQENYGKSSYPETLVKQIYNDLEIDEIFYIYEKQVRADILQMIHKLPSDVPKEPFLNVMDVLYERQK